MSSKIVFIQDINFRASPMVRSSIRDDVVQDYAELYKVRKRLPEIVLFYTKNKEYLIGDGMHRAEAQRLLEKKTVQADVRNGEYDDALKFALLANEKHGLRRSREDKRQCIAEVLKRWPGMSNSSIAEMCAVDDHTVKAVRVELEEKMVIQNQPVITMSDGRERKASTEHGKEDKAKVSEIREPSKTEEVKDGTGYIIPVKVRKYWERADEVKALLRQISDINSAFKQIQREEDIMYGEVNFSSCIANLDQVWHSLQTAIPYAVCTQCQGHPSTQPKGECRLCKKRGLISKFKWDTVVPAEVRKLRMAAKK